MDLAQISRPALKLPVVTLLALACLALVAGAPASGKSTAEHTQDVFREHGQVARGHAVAKERFEQAAQRYTDAVADGRQRLPALRQQLDGARGQIAAYQHRIDQSRRAGVRTDDPKIEADRQRKGLVEDRAAAVSGQMRLINRNIQSSANTLRDAARQAGFASQAVRTIFTGELPQPGPPNPPADRNWQQAAERIVNTAGQAIGHHGRQNLAEATARNEATIRSLNEAIQTLPEGSAQRRGLETSRAGQRQQTFEALGEFRRAERQYRALLSALDQFHADDRPPPANLAPANFAQAQPPGPAAAANLAQGGFQYSAPPVVAGAPPAAPAPPSTYDVVTAAQMAAGPAHDYESADGLLDGDAAAAPAPQAAAAQINQAVVHHNQFAAQPVEQAPWADQF